MHVGFVGDADLDNTEDADDAADSESVSDESSESDDDDDESDFNVDSLIVGTNTGISCTFDFTGI
jgi:hypothetical protein